MSKTKKPEIKTYLFHELSSIFPLIEGDEFNSLVEDIREKGQLEDGILFEGKILDGRNRYRACQILKISFRTKEYSSDLSARDYIISTNLHRRHLNIAQRSAIGLLLLEEEEKKAAERKRDMAKKNAKIMKRDEEGQFKEPGLLFKNNDPGKKGEGRSVDIVAPKVKVGSMTLTKAKKIEKIAKGYTDKKGIKHSPEPFIAKQWEEAKKGETTVDAVYEKAKIIESVSPSLILKSKIVEKISKGESTEQIKQEVQDLKDNMTRAEIAKRNRAMQKKKEEMEKLRLKIVGLNKKVYELEDAFKSSEARLVLLSKETIEKYPNLESDDPAYVLTHLDEYYDTLDMKMYDTQLKELRNEYDILEKPLRDKLTLLENEYKTKKEVIDKQKFSKNKEVSWVEKQQDLISGEFDKQDLYKESIEKVKEEIKGLQEKYDNG